MAIKIGNRWYPDFKVLGPIYGYKLAFSSPAAKYPKTDFERKTMNMIKSIVKKDGHELNRKFGSFEELRKEFNEGLN